MTADRIDFILLGNMGRSEGGRETWLYNFLPRLLADDPDLRIRLYAQRTEGHADTTPDLVAAMGAAADRFEPVFFHTRRGRLPLFLAMMGALRRYTQDQGFVAPRYSAATGVLEMVIQMFSPKLRRAKRIIWLRGIFMDEKAYRIPAPLMPLARRLEAHLLRSPDLLLCNGDDIAAYYAGYGLDVKVIKNSVELKKWDIPPPKLKAPIKVAFIGRPTKVKGAEEFLAAAHALKDDPGVEFHVYGDGPYAPQMREAEAAGALHYHGAVDNNLLPGVLKEIDVCVAFTFVSPTQGGGGTSNALMEQMAAGRVVIAWDNVIFRQMIDGENGYLVPQGDVGAVVAAIRNIAADPKAAAAKGAKAKQTMSAYSYEAQMERYAATLAAAGL